MDANTIANIVIAGTSVIGAGLSIYQASRADGSAKRAKQAEDRITILVANTQNFAPHIQVTNNINTATTALAEATAPSMPVVKPQIEEERKD